MHFPDNQLDLHCGPGTFGPKREYRCLDSIWPSLRDPSCTGPDPVYAIAMDVGRTEDLSELKERMLLFRIVICAIRKVRRRTREQPGPCFTPLPRIVDGPRRSCSRFGNDMQSSMPRKNLVMIQAAVLRSKLGRANA